MKTKTFKNLIDVRPNDNIGPIWITIEKKNIDNLNQIISCDRDAFENLLLEKDYYMYLSHGGYIWENILPYANKKKSKLLKKSYPNKLTSFGNVEKKYDKTIKCYKNLIYTNIYHRKFLIVLEKRKEYDNAYIKRLIPIKDNKNHNFSLNDTIECAKIKYVITD